MEGARKRDSPPAGFTIRPARHEDIREIIALVDAMDTSFGHVAMTLEREDFENDWRNLNLETDTWALEAPHGALAAYATLSDEGQGQLVADGYVHPEWRGRGLGAMLLRLTEARARELITAAPAGARVTLLNSVLAEDEAARALLEGMGYSLTRVFWRMRLEMTEPPPAPQWPAGVRVRAFEWGRDDRAVYEVVETAFGDHWGHTPTTFEEWNARMTGDSADPSLWYLVETDEGELVAVAFGRMRPEQGWVRTVATRRDWRRCGLGRALLLQCFCAFWERGQRAVGLGVDSQSLTGAAHLYESVGMDVEMRIATYEKELRSGENLVVRSIQA
ncbi:MAG TPA: GNAT family N-acetyltransferase [Ktedonobacterales bacterium]|nr:GNAT family N-acetyltransferase [Ktedonobacterales bacterium]